MTDRAATDGAATHRAPSTHDVIVIGSGSGGLTAAVGLSRFGKRVMLIEADKVGGECTNLGCIPSKALLHHSAHQRGRTSAEVLAAVRAARDHLREEETETFGSMDRIDLRFGQARLVSEGQVEVAPTDGSDVWTAAADHIVIATGSRARRIEIPGLPSADVLTNEEIFELDHAPGHLAIVGAGAIGLEMAVAFRRLGSQVTVLEMADQIMPSMLNEAATVLQRALEAQGIRFVLGAEIEGFDRGTLRLAAGDRGVSAVDGVDKVLLAIGRLANTDYLGLSTLGVEVDDEGLGARICIDDKGRSSVAGVWATGDCTTEGATTHDANAWGRRIIKHLLAEDKAGAAGALVRPGDRPLRPATVFTEPEAASIGDQPADPSSEVRRLRLDLSKTDRGFTDEVAHGLIVVDVARFTGEILGATIVGPRAGELISIFSLAMKTGIKFHQWYGVVWPYPSYADALGRLVDDYMSSALPDVGADAMQWAKSKLPW